MKVEERKLQEIAGSLLATIPKSWTKQYNLKKGSKVSMILEDDGSLKVVPKFKETKKIEKVGIKFDKYVIRKFFREYLLGKNIIEIFSDKPISQKQRENITNF